MDIDVTAFVQNHDMFDFAHSQAEHGLGNAGEATWKAAVACARQAYAGGSLEGEAYPMDAETAALCMLVTPATRGEIEGWLGEFGAWSEEEIAAMSDIELCALVYQFIAGDARRMIDAAESAREEGADIELAMEALAEREGGALWCADPTDARSTWTLYVGI